MAKRKQNDGGRAVAEPAKIDPAQDRINGRKIAERAGIKLDKQARRIVFAGKVAIRVVPWRPYECWDDAMLAAVVFNIEVVTVADGPRGLCERILEK